MNPLVVAETAKHLDSFTSRWRKAGENVAMVPTMGSLHQGHLALVKRAREVADRVVVTIFVNPLQFGQDEDFEKYPRQLASDLEFLVGHDVDLVFAPSLQTVYPEGETLCPMASGPVGAMFEGASRPGHFDGVLTVVFRLCELVKPHHAVFGKKDAQQLHLITDMISRQGLPITVHEVDTVRAADGLALSSRNAYLDPAERQAALAIPRALGLASQEQTPAGALAAARLELRKDPGIALDYLDIVDTTTFRPLVDSKTQASGLMIVAAVVGGTRLIDNQLLAFHQ
jgi:pantoate--beta-alanine ligase